ncbi:MAG: beta-lactamase family protein [Thermoanaerobaculia bacterium]|nr:beta-lactamase family protein [Thermoanaerobaculia bacterium]
MSRELRLFFISLVTLAALSDAANGQESALGAQPFPTAAPESVGLSAKSLERLAGHVQTLVDRDEIVGGELHVIKNRLTVMRRAFGWHDRANQQPLAVDSIYCVRSMTKPLVGTAIQMLIDDGRLRLDAQVGDILPAFATPRLEEITVEHLLTHTSGLPFSTIRRPLSEYRDLQDVAAEAAEAELEFAPGTDFTYSDPGSDVLGAIVASITGEPVEEFLQRRILGPLGMRESFTLLEGADDALARIPSAYSGGTESWSRHWQPSDPPIFPLFLTSQSLYSTTEDYARFLALWMDGGRVAEQQLLSAEAAERALTPHSALREYASGFGELRVWYAQQWMVYSDAEGRARPTVIGHGGSDGTHAWAWPEEDLMVLFFTQSRGTTAGVGLESRIQQLVVDQALAESRSAASAKDESVAGLYWDETNSTAYYVIEPRPDGGVALERPGKARLLFKPSETADRFVHEAYAGVWIEFLRDEEGLPSAMRSSFGGQVEVAPRHVRSDTLPTIDEVVATVEAAHNMARLSEIGTVELRGNVTLETLQMGGEIRLLFDAERSRSALDLGSVQEVGVVEAGRAWHYSTPTGLDELEGARLEQALLDRLVVTLGDWRRHFQHVEVLRRIQAGDDTVLLVRVVPAEAPGRTIFVHEGSGRVVMAYGLVNIPGLGVVGLRTRFGDFREVGEMLLPFQIVAEFASPQIGRVVTQMDDFELGIECKKKRLARRPTRGSGC